MVDLYTFCTSENRNEYSTNKLIIIYHFTLTVSPHYLVKVKLHMTVNHHSAFDRTGCPQLSHKVVQCLYFSNFLVQSSFICLLAE